MQPKRKKGVQGTGALEKAVTLDKRLHWWVQQQKLADIADVPPGTWMPHPSPGGPVPSHNGKRSASGAAGPHLCPLAQAGQDPELQCCHLQHLRLQ